MSQSVECRKNYARTCPLDVLRIFLSHRALRSSILLILTVYLSKLAQKYEICETSRICEFCLKDRRICVDISIKVEINFMRK